MDSKVVAADNLTIADLDGEAVILDESAGQYFGVNEVGGRILQLIREPREVRDVMNVLLDEYEVSADNLRGDLLTFLTTMQDKQLIEVVDQSDRS